MVQGSSVMNDIFSCCIEMFVGGLGIESAYEECGWIDWVWLKNLPKDTLLCHIFPKIT